MLHTAGEKASAFREKKKNKNQAHVVGVFVNTHIKGKDSEIILSLVLICTFLYDTGCDFILSLIILDKFLFIIKNSLRLYIAYLCILCSVSKSHPRVLSTDTKMNAPSDEVINQ